MVSPITHGWTSAETPDGSDVTPTNFNDHINTDAGAFTWEWQATNGVSINTFDDVTATFPGTITGWEVFDLSAGAASSSATFGLWKDTYANWPPTSGDSITASAPPTLTSAAKAASTTLTGWTTSFAVGDIIRAVLASVTGPVTHIRLRVTYTRTS